MQKMLKELALISLVCVGIIDATCFKSWHAWSACSSSCGGGVRRRTRDVIVPCTPPDDRWHQTESCGHLCSNGGSFRNGNCSCSPRWTGKCCEAQQFCHVNNGGCPYICKVENGIPVCACKDGFQLQADGISCTDIDECRQNKCDHTCTNTIGSFQCACRHGYQLSADGLQCEDVDECTLDVSRCDHTCTNTQGSFRCECKSGYRLGADRHTCTDIDECASGNSGCSQRCINDPGTFHCECNAGYRFRSGVCIDIDECVEDVSGCSQICHNTESTFVCGCQPGFKLNSDGKRCDVNNYCDGVICLNGGACVVKTTSFECVCLPGYTGIHCENDINECASPLKGGCEDKCVNTIGSYRCICNGPKLLADNGRSCQGGATSPSVFSRLAFARKLLPRGCYSLSVNHQRDRRYDEIGLISTSPWYRLRSNASICYTSGIVFSEIQSLSIPLSLTGATAIDMTHDIKVVSDVNSYSDSDGIQLDQISRSNCIASNVTLTDIRELLTSNSFLNSFFYGLESILPIWFKVSSSGSTITLTDMTVDLVLGREVQDDVWCKGAPLYNNHLYAVLKVDSDLSLSFYGQNFTIPTAVNQKFCFIIDISKDSYGTVFLMLPERSRSVFDSFESFRHLYETKGIRIKPRGIGVSVQHNIQVARQSQAQQLWGGDEMLRQAHLSDANIWVGGNAFLNISVLKIAASADIFFSIPTSNQIVYSLIYEEWKAYCRLDFSADIEVNFRLFGSRHVLKLPNAGAGSIDAYASFGGVSPRQWCGANANPSGIFLAMTVAINPFKSVPVLNSVTPAINAKMWAFFPSYYSLSTDTDVTNVIAPIRNLSISLKKFTHLLNNVTENCSAFLDTNSRRYLRELENASLSLTDQIESVLKRRLTLDELIEAGDIMWENQTRIVNHAMRFTDSVEFNINAIKHRLTEIITSELKGIGDIAKMFINHFSSGISQSMRGSEGFGLRFRGSLIIFGLDFGDLEFELLHSVHSTLLCHKYQDISDLFHDEKFTKILGTLYSEYIRLGQFVQLHKAGFIWTLSTETPEKHVIQLLATVSLFGQNIDAEVIIDQHGLKSKAVCPIWGTFVAELDVFALHGKHWYDLVYEVKGVFKTVDVEGDTFGNSYLDGVRKLVSDIGRRANERLSQAQDRLSAAQNLLSSVQSWLTAKQNTVRHANAAFDSAVRSLEHAKQKVESAKGPFLRAIQSLNAAQRKVDNICSIRTCAKLCVPGIRCSICHKKIWFVRVPYPCCHTTSCMFSIPNPICVAANLGCRAIRGIAYAALETAKLFVRVPMLALDVAKGALSAAQLVVDKSRVVLDVAVGALELAKIGLEGAKGILEGAKLAIEAVKTVVKIGLKVFDLIVQYTLQKLIDVRDCGFDVQLSTADIAVFSVQCDVNAFMIGWKTIKFTINFRDIVQTLWQAVKATVTKLLEGLGSLLSGRRRRDLAIEAISISHRFIRSFRNNTEDDVFKYLNESFDVTSQTTGFKTTDAFDDADIRIEIFHEKCTTYINITSFFDDAVDVLIGMINETTSLFPELSLMNEILTKHLNISHLQANMTLEQCGINIEVAKRDYNLTADRVYLELEEAKKRLSTDPLIMEMNNIAGIVRSNQKSRYEDITNIKIINQWIMAMENATNEYFAEDVCVSFMDCSHYAISELYDLFYAENLPNTTASLQLISQIEDTLLNLAGNASDSIVRIYELSLQLKKQLQSFEESIPFCSEAPIIVAPLLNQTIIYGRSLSLLCNATGNPQPVFWWFKDDLPIRNEHSETLRFSNTTASDAARYRCVAGNIVANRSSSVAHIYVEVNVIPSTESTNETTTPIEQDGGLGTTIVTCSYVVGSAVVTSTIMIGFYAVKRRFY